MEHLNALPAGTRLGEYEIESVLGAGGFGITYRAYDANLKKIVALKEYLPSEIATRTHTRTVMPTSPANQADYQWGLERFLDEARTLARFDHPHLNKVHRYFEAHGTAYLVLEYIEGETLSALLRQHQTLRQGMVKRLLANVLSGLEAVHAAGYVHRDLKPGNLMIQPDGSVVVLDFGAARQAVGQRSKSITSILTPGYAPIEQYDTKAEDVGPWSDMYALGMVAYRCVSGLGDGDLPDAVTRSRAGRKGSGDLEPAASIGRGRYDARLLQAIDWAIQVEETDRPQSIGEWRTTLPPLDAREPFSSPSQPSVSESERLKPAAEGSTSRFPRWATIVGIAGLVVAAVGGAYWLGQRTPVMPPEQAAVSPAVSESRQADSPAAQAPTGPSPTAEEPVVSSAPVVLEPLAPSQPDPAAIETALGLEQAERRLVQQGLAFVGHDPGPMDGLFGGAQTRTRQAIRAWQADKGMEASGYLTQEQAEALMAVGQEVEEARQVAEAQAAAEREVQAADDAAYAEAARADTGEGYEAYLRAYPQGQHVQEARVRQSAAEARERAVRADDAAYAEAERADTPEAYGAYLAAYPQGRHVAEARRRQRQWRAGQTFRDDLRSGGQGPQLVVVPAGTYRMGSPSYEEGRDDDEGPVHRVTLGQPFAVGVYEVTRGEYGRFVGATGYAGGNSCHVREGGSWGERSGRNWRNPGFRQSEREPVVCVNWRDAQAYVEWLSRETGQSYRLLSEAEWEYVARAGTTTARYWGEGEAGQCRYANGADSRTDFDWRIGCDDGYARTAPVGSYQQNAFGLYDVLGNVWEWTQDCWNGSYAGAPSAGRVWESGDCGRRVLRGGSWVFIPRDLRSADRDWGTTDFRNVNYGFRIARSLP